VKLESLTRLFRRRATPANPRPVRVDERGRIFEASGEPIVVEGLEPEKVLEGLADDDAGRTRALREIIAERRK
jgi:hypothetical protein